MVYPPTYQFCIMNPHDKHPSPSLNPAQLICFRSGHQLEELHTTPVQLYRLTADSPMHSLGHRGRWEREPGEFTRNRPQTIWFMGNKQKCTRQEPATVTNNTQPRYRQSHHQKQWPSIVWLILVWISNDGWPQQTETRAVEVLAIINYHLMWWSSTDDRQQFVLMKPICWIVMDGLNSKHMLMDIIIQIPIYHQAICWTRINKFGWMT